MNLREKYYFVDDDSSQFLTSKKNINKFENKFNLKVTEAHKNFLMEFRKGGYVKSRFYNSLAYNSQVIQIFNIHSIDYFLSGKAYGDYSEIKNLKLIPFASSAGNIECYIGGGEDNLGDIYFCDHDNGSIENRVLICKGFDTFMSAYKKREGYD